MQLSTRSAYSQKGGPSRGFGNGVRQLQDSSIYSFLDSLGIEGQRAETLRANVLSSPQSPSSQDAPFTRQIGLNRPAFYFLA